MAKKIIYIVLILLVLQGCSFHTQTTSGKEYLNKYDAAKSPLQKNVSSPGIEEQIRQAASVEPTLKFPARIGLARIEDGKLSAIPGAEIESWGKAKEKLGSNFGEFVPISPMVAHMVASSFDSDSRQDRIGNLTNKIRLGAARQHLDAVMVYEVYSKKNNDSNALALGDLTIIGAFILPSRELEVEGLASGMLIDVMQGYPYGTIETTVSKEEFSPSFGSRQKSREMANEVTTQAVQQLAEESVQMLTNLRVELAEKRAMRN